MKTNFSNLAKYSKGSASRESLTILLCTLSDFKKGGWKKHLPPDLRDTLEALIARQKDKIKAGTRLKHGGLRAGEEDLWFVIWPEKADMFNLLEFARDTLKDALSTEEKNLRLVFLSQDTQSGSEAFGAAVAARTFNLPVYGKRQKEQKPWLLESVEIVGTSKNLVRDFNYGKASSEGTNMVRELGVLPSNFLTPDIFGKRILALGKEEKLSVKFVSNKELKKMGAGAFTAVDQGNPDSNGGIYTVSYIPKVKPRKKINLVGKGICFDTGGYDIKTEGGMASMKGDMQGAAVALATVVLASRLKLPYKMSAFLALTENHISPEAYKADDVVFALNGMSIEVVDTDSEGRMILADTLTMASREKPDLVIDFATLTGSAVRSIGTKYSAGFTNLDRLHDPIRKAGQSSGERVWTFPMDESFLKDLESKVADILQCARTPGIDHILAAGFLSKFVQEGVPWVHIDLSAAENESGLAHVDSINTGFGVRWALEFIKSFNLRP